MLNLTAEFDKNSTLEVFISLDYVHICMSIIYVNCKISFKCEA